jgi:hypothetical protein
MICERGTVSVILHAKGADEGEGAPPPSVVGSQHRENFLRPSGPKTCTHTHVHPALLTSAIKRKQRYNSYGRGARNARLRAS